MSVNTNDPIVYQPNACIHLKANRYTMTAGSTDQPLTWREDILNCNSNKTFAYQLDTTNARAPEQYYVTLLRSGNYQLSAQIAKAASGTHQVTLTVGLLDPDQPINSGRETVITNEIANVDDGADVNETLSFYIPPSKVGSKLIVWVKTPSANITIRGYSYGSASYDDGGYTGSFLSLAYRSP